MLFHSKWFIFPLVSCPCVHMLGHPSSYGHFLTIVWRLFKRCIGYYIQPSYFLQWWWRYSVQVFQSHIYTVHVLCNFFFKCLIRLILQQLMGIRSVNLNNKQQMASRTNTRLRNLIYVVRILWYVFVFCTFSGWQLRMDFRFICWNSVLSCSMKLWSVLLLINHIHQQ